MHMRVKKQNKLKEVKESFEKTLYDSYALEYKGLHEIWRSLDSKAQGTVAVAGIFIGGVFNYIRDIKATNPLTPQYEKNFLAFSVLCLVICVLLSVWALRVREVKEPPIGKDLDQKIKDLLQNEAESDFDDHLKLFPVNRFQEWSVAHDDINKLNKSKATCLWWAHVSLMIAILTVALLSILKLLDFSTL